MKSSLFSFLTMLIASSTFLVITPAVASDYTLEIFGNANMDDTINEDDIEYVEGIIDGTNDATELADANYDGRIDEEDVTQIECIIYETAEQIFLIDGANRRVKIPLPVEGVVPLVDRDAKILAVLDAQDLAVGVSENIKTSTEYQILLPELTKLTSVGSWTNPDLEAVLTIEPDLLIAYSTNAERINDSIGEHVAVLGFSSSTPETTLDELLKLGYVLNRNQRAREYVDEFHDKYLHLVEDRIKDVTSADRPSVYVESSSEPYKTYNKNSVVQKLINLSGGVHIFSDLEGSGAFATLDAEEILNKDPDIIIKYADKADSGYSVSDSAKMEDLREELLDRQELVAAEVNAVKDDRVYVMSSYLSYGPDYPVLLMYWSKWLHPDLFNDINPQEIHKEYFDRFYETNYSPDQGVFVYPPLGES